MKTTLGKLERGDHVTIVGLGDSITHVTFHTQGRMNWLQLLAEAIFERYGNAVATLINAGECGGTVASALPRLERDVLRFTPDLTLVAFGMNDAGRGPAGLSAFEADLRTLVERLRGVGSEILLRTPNPVVTVNGLPVADLPPGSALVDDTHHQGLYAEAIVRLAAELDCPVVDHYRSWTEAEFDVPHRVADPNGLWVRMSDAVHPGAAGHLAFYRDLAPHFNLPRSFPWEVQ